MIKLNFFKMLLWINLVLFSVTAFAETPQGAKEIIKDSVITGAIKAKIIMDQSISVFHIDVTTKDGIVTLSGTVNSNTQARALVNMVKSTDGVRQVNVSRLNIVQSTQYFTDTLITAEIKGLLLREKLFGRRDIPMNDLEVETNNGVVYLSGRADNQEQIDNAIVLAKTIDGVKEVESRIRVIR